MRFLVKGLLCLLLGCIIGQLTADALYPKLSFNKSAIVRLHDSSTNAFFCSATIISDKLAVTAAHCLLREVSSIFSQESQIIPVASLTVVLQNGLKIPATVAGMDPSMDQGLITGDFTGLPRARLETRTEKVVQSMQKKVTSCGFPLGGALYCEDLEQGRQSVFVFAFHGYLYPGMSGGPAFNSDGVVVGTNFAATEAEILIAGTQEEFVSTSVKEAN